MLQAIPILIRVAVFAGAAKAISGIYKNREISTLSQTSWKITRQNKTDIGQTITFKDDGEIFGFGGCNRVFGQYSQSGDKLTIGTLASTRKAGPNLKAETKMISALQKARRFKGTPSQIKIYSETDEVLLTLTRQKI
ncbi:MAG: META domain-containing protein [Litorimonas sp.]